MEVPCYNIYGMWNVFLVNIVKFEKLMSAVNVVLVQMISIFPDQNQ